MSDSRFIDILKNAFNEQLKVSISTVGTKVYYHGYIMDVGDDYVRFRESKEDGANDIYIKTTYIEAVFIKSSK
jgi:hypothetical protein